jgi:hypothetical protein
VTVWNARLELAPPLVIKVRGGKSVCPFLPEAAVVVLMPVRSQPEGTQQSAG